MSYKSLLGLESFNLTEREIVDKIKHARSKHRTYIEFVSPNKKVVIKLNPVDPAGIMRGRRSYYSEGG